MLNIKIKNLKTSEKLIKSLSNHTKLNIYLILNDWINIKSIAEHLNFSCAHISVIISQMEKLDIVKSKYVKVDYAISKMVKRKYDTIVLEFN